MTFEVNDTSVIENTVNKEVGFVFYDVDTDITSKLVMSSDEAIGSTLEAIIEQRIDWENNEYARSNAKLYCILTECYEVFQNMNGLDDESRVCQSAFKRVCKAKGYVFSDSAHLTAQVVQFVFGVNDRRRVSSYAKVLRAAQENSVKTEGLADFIIRNRGIEEIRRGNVVGIEHKKETTVKTQMSSETKGRAAIYDAVLDSFSSYTLTKKFDASAYKNSVLLLATTKDGTNFDIRRIIQEDSVISAAYKHLSKTVSEASLRQMIIEDAKMQEDDESETDDEVGIE